MKNLLLHYVNYNLWANERMAERLASIEPILLDQTVKSSFPSLRETAFHIWDAETIWLNRIKGISPKAWPSKSLPTETAIDAFVATSREFAAVVLASEEDFLGSAASYTNLLGKEFDTEIWQMVMHCMNHSTFHRGQLVTMLRQLDVTEILPTDLIYYLRFND